MRLQELLTRASCHLVKMTVVWIVLLHALLGFRVDAQVTVSVERQQDKIAVVSFVNACSTTLSEAWRASVDVWLKDEPLCQDLRIGESSLLREIEVDGQALIEVRKHGTDKVLARVSAALRAGSFSSLILTGVIEDKQSAVEAVTVRDFPLTDTQRRPGLARLVLVTGIQNYPTNVEIGGESFKDVRPATPKEVFMSPGEKEIKMAFRDQKLGADEFHTTSGLLALPGNSYNLIFMDSPRLPGRPRVLVLPITEQRNEFLAAAEAAKEDSQSE